MKKLFFALLVVLLYPFYVLFILIQRNGMNLGNVVVALLSMILSLIQLKGSEVLLHGASVILYLITAIIDIPVGIGIAILTSGAFSLSTAAMIVNKI